VSGAATPGRPSRLSGPGSRRRAPLQVALMTARAQENGRIYLVMEYCSGGDLAAFIRQRRSVAEAEARALMQQLAAGLHELWSRNLVHVRAARPCPPWGARPRGPGVPPPAVSLLQRSCPGACRASPSAVSLPQRSCPGACRASPSAVSLPQRLRPVACRESRGDPQPACACVQPQPPSAAQNCLLARLSICLPARPSDALLPSIPCTCSLVPRTVRRRRPRSSAAVQHDLTRCAVGAGRARSAT